VDIELRTESGLRGQLLAAARAHGSKVIISSHDFATTPSWKDLCCTLQRMRESGGDMGKVVTTASTSEEALRILSLQLDALATGFPLSAFAMGEAGRITRFATLYLGGCMTYVAPDELSATAPGQLTVTQLRALIALFERQP
jgi:3-dehydroquinate dehydratase-1/3-dehydroquinate dehydratase/shikimate dehydrogenase